MTHQHSCQMGLLASLSHDVFHFLGSEPPS